MLNYILYKYIIYNLSFQQDSPRFLHPAPPTTRCSTGASACILRHRFRFASSMCFSPCATSIPLRFISVAGIRQMPAKTQKNSLLHASMQRLIFLCLFWRLAQSFRAVYSITEATRPDPTVRPPSRIANVRPCSIATG